MPVKRMRLPRRGFKAWEPYTVVLPAREWKGKPHAYHHKYIAMAVTQAAITKMMKGD